ncbi:MAG: hypothetical protein AAFY31_04045 [Pseudomonadota bacterium]
MDSLLDRGHFALGAIVGVCSTILFILAVQLLEFGWTANETLFGAIIGGTISGAAALLATIVANYFLVKTASSQQFVAKQASALSTFSRLTKLRDVVVKSHAHYHDEKTRSNLRLGDNIRLPMPLQGAPLDLRFDEKDLVLVLAEKEADLFNRLLDAEGVLRQLTFLKDKYAEFFFRFSEPLLKQNGTKKDGLMVQGAVEVDNFELSRVVDARDHLLSMLDDGISEVRETHEKYIDFLQRSFGTKIGYQELLDVSATHQITAKYKDQ